MNILRDKISGREHTLRRHATQFRHVAYLSWSAATVHPDYNYDSGPAGQCGVTNFGFGLWLAWLNIANPMNMHYVRGQLAGAGGEIIDGNHARLEVSDPRAGWQFDFTLHQYPGGQSPFVQRLSDTPISELQFTEIASTPISEYDTAKFGGRLALFAANFSSAAAFLHIDYCPRNNWWPPNSQFD